MGKKVSVIPGPQFLSKLDICREGTDYRSNDELVREDAIANASNEVGKVRRNFEILSVLLST